MIILFRIEPCNKCGAETENKITVSAIVPFPDGPNGRRPI